jgi:hypothetical protein
MTPTPRRRYYQTQWQLVKKWSKHRYQQAEINRDIDAILEQSLKDVGYRAEHVSMTKNIRIAHIGKKHKQVTCLVSF